jgi:hypothetical protein
MIADTSSEKPQIEASETLRTLSLSDPFSDNANARIAAEQFS